MGVLKAKDELGNWVAVGGAYESPAMRYDVIPVPGRWMTSGGASSSTTGTTDSYALFMAVRCPPCDINALGMEVIDPQTAVTLYLSIYKCHPTLAQPDELLFDAGSMAVGAAGFKSMSFSAVHWPGGMMFLGLRATGGGMTIRGAAGHGEQWVAFDDGQTPPALNYRSWSCGFIGTAWPDPLPSVGLHSGYSPKIAFKTE